ncbi:hypothetical protein [Rickettsia fournieri]|nr:hypothetical protein [Rickettsia fournieri]
MEEYDLAIKMYNKTYSLILMILELT